MKGIIRWLADVSGVSKEIRNEQTKTIGNYMFQNGYWFTGGLEFGEGLHDAANVMFLYGNRLNQGDPIPDIDSIRKSVYAHNKNKTLVCNSKIS